MKQININEEVTVKLTNSGANFLTAFEKKCKEQGIDTHSYLDYRFDDNGNLKITLWCLMQIFGGQMLGNAFFENGGIIMNDEDIKDYSGNVLK